MTLSVSIIGAGLSGLVTAKTLIDFGHSVTVLDKSPDIGGVWSAGRRYPGLALQNPRDTYCFSTLPMPCHYPTHPSGEQVQEYLQAYAAHHSLDEKGSMRLGTEVIEVSQLPDGRWSVTSKYEGTNTTEEFDILVVTTGTFSEPYFPSLPGADHYIDSGGKILHTSQVHDYAQLTDRNVVILGYGKSACDAAMAAQRVAKTTHMVVRHVTWKLPTYLAGLLHFSYLLLTQVGEALFKYIRPSKTQRSLHSAVGRPIRNMLLGSLALVTRLQLKLDETNLLPTIPFETIACSTISLATDGLYNAILNGRIAVHRDTEIQSLSDGSAVTLTTGETIIADTIICGTGWTQRAPDFLPPALTSRLVDDRGNWILTDMSCRLVCPTYISTDSTHPSSPLSRAKSAHCGSPPTSISSYLHRTRRLCGGRRRTK